jgi:hypothetical protein
MFGNLVTGHSGSGIVFASGGELSRVEGNRFTGNATYGVEFHSVGGDFGGGPGGSAGHNVFSCNLTADVFSDVVSGTIAVCFDQWDHVPPTQTGGAGIDILNTGGATVVFVGATLGPGGCP